MENQEINIAEILEDCPMGTKLYSVIHGDVTLFSATNDGIFCQYSDEEANIHKSMQVYFHSDGKYCKTGECVLFPSKDQRDWSKFKKPVVPPFEIKRNGKYYHLNQYLEVFSESDERVNARNSYWESGNYFNTREQAEYAAEKVKELLLSLRKEEKYAI